jgi:hypothetical protein
MPLTLDLLRYAYQCHEQSIEIEKLKKVKAVLEKNTEAGENDQRAPFKLFG